MLFPGDLVFNGLCAVGHRLLAVLNRVIKVLANLARAVLINPNITAHAKGPFGQLNILGHTTAQQSLKGILQ